MSSSILEKNKKVGTEQETWRILHRADLDNCHIELCWDTVRYLQSLPEKEMTRDRAIAMLSQAELPKIPLEKVMGVLFP